MKVDEFGPGVQYVLAQISPLLCFAKERILPTIGAQEDDFLGFFPVALAIHKLSGDKKEPLLK